ncbi:WG repeat-containing protein [Mesorhizobium sp. WSM3864]|uniref:WG repeat-containing protein n=1 Tax=Mesorhizobium sp. WSM3864 TaxID=2029404 RepID=UPI0014833DBE|nr:WG repeat-containing protein [Mesorhizobium sp. WSM3864]
MFEPVLDVAWPLFNGLAEAKLNGKYGFLDRSMNWIIKPIYDKAEDFGDLIHVELGGHEMYIDRLGSNLNGSAA